MDFEKDKARKRRYNNSEKGKKCKRSWAENNPEKMKEISHTWNTSESKKLVSKRYYAKNREKLLANHSEKLRHLREEVLVHYSGKPPKCACCKEDIFDFLTIDHINRKTGELRKEQGTGGLKLYRWLKKHDFPEGYQVLCWNCNRGKYLRGICPHKL